LKQVELHGWVGAGRGALHEIPYLAAIGCRFVSEYVVARYNSPNKISKYTDARRVFRSAPRGGSARNSGPIIEQMLSDDSKGVSLVGELSAQVAVGTGIISYADRVADAA
jgi:hypothetical protein